MRRKRDDQAFKVIPVVAGYEDIETIYGYAVALDDLGRYNIVKVDSDPLSKNDAVRVARKALRERLRAIVATFRANNAVNVLLWGTIPSLEKKRGDSMQLLSDRIKALEKEVDVLKRQPRPSPRSKC